MANHTLKLIVKQGEELSRLFTIKQDGNPMDLTDYIVRVQVKDAPYKEVEPKFEKIITTTSDINKDGQITTPTSGEFQVRLLEEDTSYPVGEYYLIISLINGETQDIISSNYCNNALYIICTQ